MRDFRCEINGSGRREISFCEYTDAVKKQGLGNAGHQRYRCYSCCRTFQLDYAYRACRHGIKEQIVDLAMNNARIRDACPDIAYQH